MENVEKTYDSILKKSELCRKKISRNNVINVHPSKLFNQTFLTASNNSDENQGDNFR